MKRPTYFVKARTARGQRAIAKAKRKTWLDLPFHPIGYMLNRYQDRTRSTEQEVA